MKTTHALGVGFAALLELSGCGSGDDLMMAPDLAGPEEDLLARLQRVPGLQVTEKTTTAAGYRFFHLQYEQPVDHEAPQGPRFLQRATLLHRALDAPTVVTTSGYFVTLRDAFSEVTRSVAGNQLNLEHRYFEPSRPSPADWSHLNIRQAAGDHHRVITALRAIYKRGRWLSTGGSKGGMASVFHRRFYPDDVDGTVAYVAPLLSAPPDARYDAFIDRVGERASDPTCGRRLRAYQRQALARGAALSQRATALANLTFSLLTPAIAVEHALLELPFYFWQYGDERACANIPAAGASDDDLFKFLNSTHPLLEFSDGDITAYRPYYYQSGTEEGYPAFDEAPLRDLLRAPGTYVPQTYLPKELPARFDPAPMADISRFVTREARHILFIYGENDPWSAAPFPLGADAAARDVTLLTVPRGNHGARMAQLAPEDLKRAQEILSKMAGVPVPMSLLSTLAAPGEDAWPWPRREPRSARPR